MKTNILAPFIKTEESFNFYVNGRAFEMKDNNLNLIESFGSELRNSIAAFESFEFGSNSIKWFHGPSKFVFDINESKFKHNDSLIEGNTFTNHVLSAGMVRYNDKPKAELFESLPTLLSNFIVLDFAATFEGNSNIVDVFKLDEKVYVSRFNTENRLANFFIAENANAAVEYVAEKTGESAATFLADLVEGEAKELAEKEAKIAECNEMIAFLKDQRGILAEADKSIAEIKAADTLINEEIAKWEAKKINESVRRETKFVWSIDKKFKIDIKKTENDLAEDALLYDLENNSNILQFGSESTENSAKNKAKSLLKTLKSGKKIEKFKIEKQDSEYYQIVDIHGEVVVNYLSKEEAEIELKDLN